MPFVNTKPNIFKPLIIRYRSIVILCLNGITMIRSPTFVAVYKNSVMLFNANRYCRWLFLNCTGEHHNVLGPGANYICDYYLDYITYQCIVMNIILYYTYWQNKFSFTSHVRYDTTMLVITQN